MRWARAALLALGFAYAFLLSLRFPNPAGVGLDISWEYGLTEAALRHVVFGRDIDFTYGPLGYLFAGIAIPGVTAAMLAARIGFSLLLAAGWCAQFFLPGTPARKALFALMYLYGLSVTRDGITGHDVVLWVALVPALLLLNATPRAKLWLAGLGAGAFAGVLGLVKFNAALTLVASLGAFFAVVALSRMREREDVKAEVVAIGLFGAAYALSTIAFFPSPVDAFGYLVASLEITHGYSSAESLAGPAWIVALACVEIGLLLGLMYLERRTLRLELCAAVFLSVFVTFKEGFVRQDLHEAVFFILAPLAFGLVVRAGSEQRALPAGVLSLAVSLLAITALGSEGYPRLPIGERFTPASVASTFSAMLAAFRDAPPDPAVDPALASDRLSPADLARIGSAGVDVIPFETALVFANGLHWAPEHVFQTYQAYTPYLDGLNARGLSDRADGVVLDSYDSIDGRYPVADVPAAFAALLCAYRPLEGIRDGIATTQGGLRLAALRKGGVTCGSPGAERHGSIAWGQRYDIPSTGAGLTFVRVKIATSPFGFVLRTLFRAPPVWMTVREPAITSRYRIVPDDAEDGILADPVPKNVDDLAKLFTGALERRPLSLEFATDDPRFYAPVIELETFERSRTLR